MPKYKCHKEVWALKIKSINPEGLLTPLEDGYGPFQVDDEWLPLFQRGDNFPPGDLGYYVVYKGGYRSWSPSKEFEEGYSPA
jgi:hypothetical protein